MRADVVAEGLDEDGKRISSLKLVIACC